MEIVFMETHVQSLTSPQELEEWFLEQLEAETLPVDPLVHRLEALYEQGARDLGDSL